MIMETALIILICISIAILIGGAAVFFAFWWLNLIHKTREDDRFNSYR